MNEVGFNQEFRKLALQYDALKEQTANQLEMYAHLVETVGPNLKARYMMLIGCLEYRMFELQTGISRWKRRFALRRRALNRGETPDYAAIEKQLDEEFAAYLEEIKGRVAALKEASLHYHAACMTEAETAAIRCTYLNAVKKLHPDINPGLPEAAVALWNQIQMAYGAQDWERFRFLAGLVDDVVTGKTAFDASADGMAALAAACEELRARSRVIAARTAELKTKVPYTYEAVLEDEECVRETQDRLKAQLRSLEACVKEYEELWNHGK